MYGDVPIEEVIKYLENNDLGLKLSDRDVVVDFIRPMKSFDLVCPYEHKVANHILNRILVRSHDVGKKGRKWKYDSWSLSVEGKQLVDLEFKWRQDDAENM